MAVAIISSVGAGGKNNAADVLAIQTLLNKWVSPQLAVTGICNGTASDSTVIAIKSFQSRYSNSPDGRIDAGGGTLKRLNQEPLVMLPQMSGFGYYSYGSDNWNERQWGTQITIDTLLELARQFRWNNPTLLLPIGDISFQFGGAMPPHGTHREGKHVDLRPLRKDGAQVPVTYTDTANYDQDKTKLLIELFLSHQNVKNILFNDPVINALNHVSPWSGHDNHFHITMIK